MASKIEQQVMASVGTIYTARRLVGPTALKLYVSVAALYGLGQLVWVQRVFENMAAVGLGGFANYAVNALLHTDVLVQLTLGVFVVAVVLLVRDLARNTAPRPLAF